MVKFWTQWDSFQIRKHMTYHSFQIRKHMTYLPWICAKVKIVVSSLFINLLNNPTKFQLIWKRTHNSVKNIQYCCDLETSSRSLKVVWTGKAQSVATSCKVWLLSHLQYLSKSQGQSFWQAQTLDWKSMLIISFEYTLELYNYIAQYIFNVCSDHTVFKL